MVGQKEDSRCGCGHQYRVWVPSHQSLNSRGKSVSLRLRRIDAGEDCMQVPSTDEPPNRANEVGMVAKGDDTFLGNQCLDIEMRSLHT